MAPEIYKEKYGPEVDLWALGGIAYFMLCGTLPMFRMDLDGIKSYVQRVTRIELPERFSDASKDFVSRLLTRDVDKRLKIEELPKHPFISSCINFSILVNPIEEDEPPTIHSYTVDPSKCLKSFVPSADKTGLGAIFWRSIISHVLRETRDLPGIPELASEDPTQVAVFTQDGVVDLDSKVDFKDELSFANIEVFMYFKSSPPAQLKMAGPPRYGFLESDVINSESISPKEKAEILLKLIHKIHDLYLYIIQSCTTAFRGIEIMEKTCASYATTRITPILNRLYEKMGKGKDTGFFSLIGPGHTDGTSLKMFNESNKTVFKMVIQQYGLLASFLDNMTANIKSDSEAVAMGKSLSLAFTQTNVTISGTSIVFDRAIESFYEFWNTLADLMAAFNEMRELAARIESLEKTCHIDPKKTFNTENDLCKEFLGRHPKWSVKVHLAENLETQHHYQKKGHKESDQTSLMLKKFLEEHTKLGEMEKEVDRLNRIIKSLQSQLEDSMGVQQEQRKL